MSRRKESQLHAVSRMVAFFCIAILCIILTAGLWPFRAPKNQVKWLSGRDGLEFGGRGLVTSDRPFPALSPEKPVTLEICLQPTSLHGSGTILAFDDFANPNYVFALRQFGNDIVVQRPAYDPQGVLVRQWWRAGKVFRGPNLVVLTIVSTAQKAVLYVNGTVASISWDHTNMSGDMTGTLVLGSSVVRDGWRGTIVGMAIFNDALTAAKIEEHSRGWLLEQPPVASGERAPAVLYQFSERAGNTVHDETEHADDLTIPARYRMVHPAFMASVFQVFRGRWDGWRTSSYWSDVAINIAGFIPFGYFFATWFSLVGFTSRPRLTALLLGIVISFAIESCQYFLPTRDSSMTDLLNNSLGTAIGVALYRKDQFQRWFVH